MQGNYTASKAQRLPCRPCGPLKTIRRTYKSSLPRVFQQPVRSLSFMTVTLNVIWQPNHSLGVGEPLPKRSLGAGWAISEYPALEGSITLCIRRPHVA